MKTEQNTGTIAFRFRQVLLYYIIARKWKWLFVNGGEHKTPNSTTSEMLTCTKWGGGPGSSVGIVTAYGLDGPGIESRWGRDFPHVS